MKADRVAAPFEFRGSPHHVSSFVRDRMHTSGVRLRNLDSSRLRV